jgi:hypothetical protein
MKSVGVKTYHHPHNDAVDVAGQDPGAISVHDKSPPRYIYEESR